MNDNDTSPSKRSLSKLSRARVSLDKIDTEQMKKLKTYIVVSQDSPRLKGSVVSKKIDHTRTPEEILIHDLIDLQKEMMETVMAVNKVSISCGNCLENSKCAGCFSCKTKVKSKIDVSPDDIKKGCFPCF